MAHSRDLTTLSGMFTVDMKSCSLDSTCKENSDERGYRLGGTASNLRVAMTGCDSATELPCKI